MNGEPAATRLIHPALEPPGAGGAPPAEARISDQQRLGVVLQAGSLLSHLELAGWRLSAGWRSARIDDAGMLRGVEIRRGRPHRLPQRSLRSLCLELFRGEPVAGRGEARRAARLLLGRWRQSLLPLSPDRAVEQLLADAHFLWLPRHRASRAALAAEHRRGAAAELWVAGPGWLRRSLLARCRSAQELRAGLEALAGADGREVGEGDLDAARRLVAAGRYERALAALSRRRSPAARLLRLRCQAGLGRWRTVVRALEALARARLTRGQVAAVAEIAVRAAAVRGRPEIAAPWTRRALHGADGEGRARAELIAAAAAWERGEPAVVRRRLERARAALERPETAWRWRHLRGLAALSEGDARRATEELAAALGASRRRLAHEDAAALWNELGIARCLDGELAAGERAFRHAARLLDAVDGPRRLTLALVNLAEARIRRGRLDGVSEILRASRRENRRAGNWRGWAHDRELEARLWLARGRPARALQVVEAARTELERRKAPWRRAELAALSARALGLSDRPLEAAAALAAAGVSPGALFEAEELPALWQLAGHARRARRAARGSALWSAALAGAAAGSAAWSELDRLEPFRAARWIVDLEAVAPGWVPPARRAEACETLLAAGADGLAARLAGPERSSWRALRGYLGSARPRLEAAGELLTGLGRGARLRWRRPGGVLEIAGGRGGERRLRRTVAGGELVLETDLAGERVEALFELLARDLEGELAARLPTRPPASGILGDCPRLRAALERVDRLATGDMPVLVLGETGTGKELVARRIHARSGRAGRRFLAVNCGALSDSLLLSELFGHARGAFTGAERSRTGVFEEAAGGTVFLDEIGDLPLEAQGTLLRVLQEGEVRRLGESVPRSVDVRVVAATHRDLAALARGGRFRQDLLYRLNGAAVRLPALRERGADVGLLARHFLRAASPPATPTPELLRALSAYPWPGNVRELKNRLEVAAALAGDGIVRRRHLDLPQLPAGDEGLYHRRLAAVRTELVREALSAADGNQAAAARRLGITRQALSYLVRSLELD